jgi:hypothetical protein
MRTTLRIAVAVTALLATAAAHAEEDAVPAAPKTSEPALRAETFEAIRDAVLPSEAEEAWRAIGWRATFWDAVVEAHEAKKPVLLWAMNGHPLGCT